MALMGISIAMSGHCYGHYLLPEWPFSLRLWPLSLPFMAIVIAIVAIYYCHLLLPYKMGHDALPLMAYLPLPFMANAIAIGGHYLWPCYYCQEWP